jgi:RND family efflux transporter MFP subunit
MSTLRGLLAATLLSLTAGCTRPAAEGSPPAKAAEKASAAPPIVVRVVRPERKTLRHRIFQPGFNIEAFQVTPVFSRIAGYVESWHVDIGDKVDKGQVLAELYVPEMVADLRHKEAAILQAKAQVLQAKANVLNAQAMLERAKSQYERLAKLGQGALDKENIEEARLGYQAAQAGRDKAQADVAMADAQVEMAIAKRDQSKALLDYAKLRAPFAGVVTQRNINTGDFAQPAGLAVKGQPLFVISQIDPVRVFVNVPGADAPWITDGDPVTLQLQGAGGEVLRGKVTRNAGSLDPKSRTLRAEIDLPNPQGRLLPGMYVQATILVEHPNVWTLPASAVVPVGDQMLCYRVVDGKTIRTPLQIGLRSGDRVEVLKMQIRSGSLGAEGRWEDVSGQEEVVASDAATLQDGQPVHSTPAGR